MCKDGRLRVAIVAPAYYELPPRDYGGIELVCYLLAEGLAKRGHDVTLVGAGKSHTRVSFIATFAEPQPEGGAGALQIEFVHAARAAAALAACDVDVVHDHSRFGPLTAVARAIPTVLTVHSALAGPDSVLLEAEALAPWAHFVAVSAAQRADAPWLPWRGTVHNGIALERYPVGTRKDGFTLYLGRISPYKGVEAAIAAARAAGKPLVIAGSWTVPEEREYFNARIRPLLGGDVEWVGAVAFGEKVDLLGRADCLLFPAQWHEPFGLVITEALACGTPVVALRRGAVPELIADGVTGVLCDAPSSLPAAIAAVGALRPGDCRAHAEARFSAEAMVKGYEDVYQRVLASDS
jgi:glycosyltransferase involved in cell wall biosynthesis